MAFLKFEGVRIAGVSAAVPRETERNAELPQFEGVPEALALFVENVGVRERRVSRERNVCASDLCCAAAERLLDALSWKREEIDALVFVSQTADYRLPATSCLLQHRLSLPSECAAFDISLGCSGWVYGMSALSALVASERENCGWGGSKILACGFGVGLSVASLHAELPRDVVVPALLEI